MQDCFRLHPEVYGEELNDDEEAEAQAPLDDAPEAAAATPAQQAPAETARVRPAADGRRNASEGRKPSARDAKKSKVPTGSELPEEVKDTASPE